MITVSRHRTSSALLLAALIPIAIAALPACNQPAAAATNPRPTPVKLQAVGAGPSLALSRYSGALEPASQVTMSFRVSGYVDALGQVEAGGKWRPLDKGDFVKRGSVLARLRAADYEHKVATGSALVSDASAKVKLSELEHERARKLFAANVISQAELDVSEAQASSARASLKDAIARSGEAGLALGDTVLRAPMDGVVIERHVEVGTLAAAGQPAVTIADTHSVKAVFGAPQVLVEKLAIGEAVQVFVGAEGEDKAPEKLLDAHVTRIAPAADSNGRVFSVEALLSNPSGTLRPGAVVSVRVPTQALARETLVVPLSAVVRSRRDPKGFSVFVFEGDADRGPVRAADVQLGEVIGNTVSVESGLASGERVVTVGSTLLRDGGSAVVIR
ncbi:MAG TPA: efflux RND transporter periplasmic adaptor subunit [Polyangiaceae bacterium]|nr:efflux RND transporter periplasmic adaptor subunit [Polyangiaceae bacterium]